MNSLLTKVVIVDDEVQFLQLMSKAAKSAGFESDTFSDPTDFNYQNYSPSDVLVLDLSMPNFDGIEFIRELANKQCQMQIILCSGQDESILKAAEDLVIAHKLNFLTTLQKPVSIKHFKQLLLENKAAFLKQSHAKVDFEISPQRLKLALRNNEIVPHYQPQVCLKTGKLLGFEALCRWHAPEFGIVPPNLFLPVAKTNQLLQAITHQMLLKSCVDMKWLNDHNQSAFHVSVNIDATDASLLSFPEYVESLVQSACFDNKLLFLEITESGMMGELTESLNILARLRMKGFSLSIDDFGTGYSSLSMLHQMPFNELKIDQSFVKTMAHDKSSLAIVETCIMLANKIGVLTVAEGIEDAKTYDALARLGCAIGQGYYIGKPMPITELQSWIEAWQHTEYKVG